MCDCLVSSKTKCLKDCLCITYKMSGRSSLDGARSRSPIRHRTAVRREQVVICKPLKSLKDIAEFLNDPPVWRSLCNDLRPHSEDVIRNLDIVEQNVGSDHEVQLERPETFCHFDVDKEDVRRHRRKSLPKTLVCHDMANGYHDDSNIDGTGNHEAYTFYNWAVVDIFCYFSHHFITIPPLGWINVGHAHGVKVIGTVITEWGEGAAIWEGLLADPEAWKGFAGNLVAIAKTLKFDGWLLNVENKISQPAALLQFVRHLRGLLHRELPAAALLWYDSVTVAGALAWQNTLNGNNKAFFDACDGIFTNYSWGEHHVRAARAAAGARARDVFVGIDVWGRNFLGGGQFNTQEAVKIVHKYELSLAIFAPAWTHEALDPDGARALGPLLRGPLLRGTLLRGTLLRERALWGSLWPLLNTRLPSSLPFATSFCTGQGRKRRLYGEVLGPVPWYNLRHQQYQPNAALGPHGYRLAPRPPDRPPGARAETDRIKDQAKDETAEPEVIPQSDERDKSKAPPRSEEKQSNAGSDCVVIPTAAKKSTPKRYRLLSTDEEACLELWLDDSFTGGGCLLVNAETSKLIRLFHCDFAIRDSLVACVVTKTLPGHEDMFLNVILSVQDESGRQSRVTLSGSGGEAGADADADAVAAAAGAEFQALRRYLLLHQPGFYVSVENAYGWKVRYWRVPLAGRRVSSVSCGGAGPVLLGHFGLCHVRDPCTTSGTNPEPSVVKVLEAAFSALYRRDSYKFENVD